MVDKASAAIVTRRAVIADAEIIVRHRRAMFEDMGYESPATAAMAGKFLPWLLTRMESGEYLAWFALAPDGTVIAGGGLWLMDWPPHMVGAGPRRGNIVNVYTEPAYRRRGIARRLMEEILAWCRQNGVDAVVLHASQEGRPLYESMGFQSTNEMRIML